MSDRSLPVAPPVELHRGSSVGELIISAIQRGGDRPLFALDERTMTYREFGDLLARFIAALAARGLRKGMTIAVLSSNRPEFFLAMAAAYLTGLRIVRMHPLGAEDDHAYMLEDAEAVALLLDPTMFVARGKALLSRVPSLAQLLTFGPSEIGEDILGLAAAAEPAPLAAAASAEDIAVITYTGGTTGRPKGVVVTHRVHVTMVLAELAEWDWPPEVRFLAMTPISHAAGSMILAVMLRSGLFVMSKSFDPATFCRLVERHRITSTFLVPTMIYVLLDAPEVRQANLSSLQLVIYGASPMSPARLKEAMERFGPIFMQLYGQTEAPNCITVLRQRDHDPRNHPHRLASCGTPIAGNLVALLDETGHEVAAGEVGEICVRGPLVMQGYWKKPEETAKTLAHGWLHTGDLARRDADGFIYIVDRAKDMIISGGFNVYPREVEDVLTRHVAVASAAVIGVPDDKWGEAVKALVVLKPGASASEAELIALVREQKGVVQAPKSIDFVGQLPMTGLGKPDKKAIRARYWQGSVRAVH